MTVEEKQRLIEEMQELEEQLRQKRRDLAAHEALERAIARANEYKYEKDWRAELDALIREMGTLSRGGNSVEDIWAERSR